MSNGLGEFLSAMGNRCPTVTSSGDHREEPFECCAVVRSSDAYLSDRTPINQILGNHIRNVRVVQLLAVRIGYACC